jgi:GT2 family glycosyltransferase
VATRIFDLDLDALPSSIDVDEPYTKALFLIRRAGVPIAKFQLPAVAGSIDMREFREAVADGALSAIAEDRARRMLGLDEEALGPSPISATVVVCTRERPDDLKKCLDSLMALPQDGQEYLVVDNRPATDATREVVERYPSVRYAREDRRGLDAGRNRAIAEARGEVIAFIDDDAVADANWLRGLLSPFRDPLVQCVTGLTMPLELETQAQEMFESMAGFSRRGFSRRVFQSPETSPLATGDIGAGANMAIRRSVADKIGLFDWALDAGTKSESGGDHEYFTRILRAGYRIVYEPRALNWHRHRRSWEELRKAMYGYGVGVYAAWTRSLLVEREWGVIRRAFGWFRHDQAPKLLKALFRNDPRMPRDLLWAELKGCWRGPWSYLAARRQVRQDAAHG